MPDCIARYAERRKPGLALLAVCQVLIGVLAHGTAALFGWLPDAFVALFGAVGETYWLFLLANFLLCFLIMVPATLFMGASFPVAIALVVESFGSSGRRIGLLYAGNTVGAILGAFLAGFVLLPWLGIQQTLVLTVLVNLASGLALAVLVLARSRAARDVWVPAAARCIPISAPCTCRQAMPPTRSPTCTRPSPWVRTRRGCATILPSCTPAPVTWQRPSGRPDWP